MMVMNEKGIRFMAGLNPRMWEIHHNDWQETYKNRSDEVAMMLNDWKGYRITHLSTPETSVVAIWLDGED